VPKVTMSVYETFLPSCKELQNHWVAESPKVGNETEVERLWVVTCSLTSHQSVKILTKDCYNLWLELKSITDMQSVLMHIIIGSDQSWTLIYHKMHAVSNANWQTNEQYWAIASKKSRSRELGFKSEYNTRLLERFFLLQFLKAFASMHFFQLTSYVVM
jgi:hypothetical protein